MIDPGFFRSRHFAIAAVVALVLVGAGAGAYAAADRGIGGHERACDARTVAGRDLGIAPAIVTEDARRVVTYTFDAGALAAGALDLCISVGEIFVSPSTGTQVELEFTITGGQDAAVEGTLVEARLADDDGILRIAAWEAQRGESRTLFNARGAEVRLVVRVPDSGAWIVRAAADVGDVRVTGLRLAQLDMHSDVGTLHATEIGLEGNASASTEVGDIILAFTSVQSGNITAQSEVGDVEVQLPRRADVGYEATARTEVGDIEVRLGEVDIDRSAEDGPGGERTVRTTGFAANPTRVGVLAETEVGDIRIVSGGTP